MEETYTIYGIHPVCEALRAGQEIEKIYVARRTGNMGAVLREAAKRNIPVVDTDVRNIARMAGVDAVHQDVCASLSAVTYLDLSDAKALLSAAGDQALAVMLCHVEDPHNVGAVARSAEALGATCLIVPKRRTAVLGGTAMKASAGALSHLPVARVPNLAQALEELKAAGIWAVGAQMDAPSPAQTNLTGPLCLCLGAEGEGIPRLILEQCDLTVGIPLAGQTASLNVSAAGAILLYEILRQRGRE